MSMPHLIEPSGQPERDIHQVLSETLPFTSPLHAASDEMSLEEMWEYSGPIPEGDLQKYHANDDRIRGIYAATLEALDTTTNGAQSLSERLKVLGEQETAAVRSQLTEYTDVVRLSEWQQIEGIHARADELVLRASTESSISLAQVADMLDKLGKLDITNERTAANLRRSTEAGLKAQIDFEGKRDALIATIEALNLTQETNRQKLVNLDELLDQYTNAVSANLAAKVRLAVEKAKNDADEYKERRRITADRLAIIGSPEITPETPKPVLEKINEIIYDPSVKSDDLIIIQRSKLDNERVNTANEGALKNNTAAAAQIESDIKNTKASLRATFAQIDAERRNFQLLTTDHTLRQEAYAAEWQKNVTDFATLNKGDTTSKPADVLLQPVFRDKTALQRAEALGSAVARALEFEEPIFSESATDGLLTPLLRDADTPESVVAMTNEYLDAAETTMQVTVDQASNFLEPVRPINTAARFMKPTRQLLASLGEGISEGRGIIKGKIVTIYNKKTQATPEEN